MNRKELLSYCMKLNNVYQNTPLRGENHLVVCHRGNRKVFAWFYIKNGRDFVRFRCSGEDFTKMPMLFSAVKQGFFNRKENVYWIEMAMEEAECLETKFLRRIIDDSFEITKPEKRNKSIRWYFT